MRFIKKDAIQSEIYIEKCYDSFLRSIDRGRMTLVNLNYFNFWSDVMKMIGTALISDRFKCEHDLANKTKIEVKNDKLLLENFFKVSDGFNFLNNKEKEQIYSELVDKIINAVFSDKMRSYREEFTVRGSKARENNLVLRQNLDALSSKKK